MKIELNTTNKTVLLKEKINLGELYDTLVEMNVDIDEYTLLIEYPTAIYIPYQRIDYPIINPYKPYEVYCGTGSSSSGSGVVTTNSVTNVNSKCVSNFTK